MASPLGNKNHFIHGFSHTRIDNIYKTMKARCYKETDCNYKKYGGRGITICEEWLNDKTKFFQWSFENGYSENLTLDRIDNDGNYSPNNCRWTDTYTQANNTRTNVFVEYCGKRYTLAELCRELGLSYKLFHKKFRQDGYSLQQAIDFCQSYKR